MEPITEVIGTACPIDANDVDTDQIVPKQFLKRVERMGYGPIAFFEWRYEEDGTPKPDFPMNKPEHQGASILLTGENFGCGSSREHAPWALEDAGFKVILAPSFADIFRNNCGNVGIVAAVLAPDVVREMFGIVAADPTTEFTVDLVGRTVIGGGIEATFELDDHTRYRLMNGLDPIGLSLQHEEAIADFEQARPVWRPRLTA